MKPFCPYCALSPASSDHRSAILRRGFFARKSDGQNLQRFYCQTCRRGFSHATFNSSYRQNKRHLNEKLRKLLCSGVSQRRSAIILSVSKTTIERKVLFVAREAQLRFELDNAVAQPAERVQFDDQETFEHTKCKPLSITLAVENKKRRILGFDVSTMAANGHLAKIALKKYGPRKDTRKQARRALFKKLKPLMTSDVLLESDQNPHYRPDVKKVLPEARHVTFKGQRGSSTGQGELKKVRFDPLFSLNHTFAMTRANINRLIRKTWCTTKKAERLLAHLYLYADFHNAILLKSKI